MSFCRPCDVYQRTVSKGSIAKVPLGKIPLMDLSLKRVAVDLIGPITPASDKGHRYAFTLVDYAIRYPEVVPLKNMDTETVAEALWICIVELEYQKMCLVIMELNLHQTACRKCQG